MLSLDERLNKAEEMIKKPSFRENKGLGNEVGYYVFDYPASQELYVRERIEYMKNRNKKSGDDFKIVVFDLYNIIIDILKEKGYLEKCYEFEKKKGFDRITKAISSMLRITSSNNLITQHIRENTPEDYIVNYQDLQGIGMTDTLALPTLIALTSIALGKPVISSAAVLGEISIAGSMIKVDELANSLQVCLDSGAKKVLLPITSAADLGTVPSELIGHFNLVFYSSAEDAVFKALGVE